MTASLLGEESDGNGFPGWGGTVSVATARQDEDCIEY
jgi:hypothetical protein